jgi:hypothetical protein
MPYFEPSEPPDEADAAFLHAAEGRDLATGFGRDDASLMPTMPYSRASATRQMRPMSRL